MNAITRISLKIKLRDKDTEIRKLKEKLKIEKRLVADLLAERELNKK